MLNKISSCLGYAVGQCARLASYCALPIVLWEVFPIFFIIKFFYIHKKEN